ncbi:MAG: substrate-binding domain-containing protein, partial [Anaerolineae bacterium]
VTTIADPFVAEIVRGVEEVALDHGYSVFLCNSNAQPQREIAAVRILRENRVDGVIVTSSRVGNLYLPLLEEMKVPIVLINNQRAGQYVWSVATDNVHGGRLATEYLIELGHRRIGYLGGSPEVSSNRDRLRGYRKALKAHGIRYDPQLVTRGNGRMEGGQKGVEELLLLSQPPTAFFCYNDMTAIGVLKALREAKLRVPQDMSVIGFDDIALAAYVEPPLTTIAQAKHEMGQLAMRMLLELLSGEKEVHNIVLQGKLIVRASCCPA